MAALSAFFMQRDIDVGRGIGAASLSGTNRGCKMVWKAGNHFILSGDDCDCGVSAVGQSHSSRNAVASSNRDDIFFGALYPVFFPVGCQCAVKLKSTKFV